MNSKVVWGGYSGTYPTHSAPAEESRRAGDGRLAGQLVPALRRLYPNLAQCLHDVRADAGCGGTPMFHDRNPENAEKLWWLFVLCIVNDPAWTVPIYRCCTSFHRLKSRVTTCDVTPPYHIISDHHRLRTLLSCKHNKPYHFFLRIFFLPIINHTFRTNEFAVSFFFLSFFFFFLSVTISSIFSDFIKKKKKKMETIDPPALPPQMFTTSAQLLDLTDSTSTSRPVPPPVSPLAIKRGGRKRGFDR